MPFTFSHPFIVLPLCASKKRIFSATGLIIGSMAMDFEYFIYMKKIEHESFHTIPGGVFIFGLPASILLAFIYHIIVRNKFIDNLPPVIQRRMAGFRELNWLSYFKTNYTTVIFSMLIGIYSHLFLDAFTHDFVIFCATFCSAAAGCKYCRQIGSRVRIAPGSAFAGRCRDHCNCFFSTWNRVRGLP